MQRNIASAVHWRCALAAPCCSAATGQGDRAGIAGHKGIRCGRLLALKTWRRGREAFASSSAADSASTEARSRDTCSSCKESDKHSSSNSNLFSRCVESRRAYSIRSQARVISESPRDSLGFVLVRGVDSVGSIFTGKKTCEAHLSTAATCAGRSSLLHCAGSAVQVEAANVSIR